MKVYVIALAKDGAWRVMRDVTAGRDGKTVLLDRATRGDVESLILKAKEMNQQKRRKRRDGRRRQTPSLPLFSRKDRT
jgi:hypothetical protein